jgi:MFS family permease
MKQQINKFSNHIKNVAHGFFLSLATTIAEPATILPLIINFFGGGAILVGFFAALLRGGAILVQLYAAFHAQTYPKMMKYLRRVFFARWLAWFLIGLSIILFGENSPTLTLVCIGMGLFVFSFSAGFGAIYFKETTAKIFTHKYRGFTMAWRQSFTAFGAIISGAVAGWVLENYEAPLSFGYLFLISSFLMGIGFIAFGTVDEPIKEKVSQKENSFKLFLKNAKNILKIDKNLQIQVITFLLAYGYLVALPFIILDAQNKIDLTGTAIGILITAQMTGALVSNYLWGKLTSCGLNKLTTNIAILMMIVAVSIAFNASHLYEYILIFFLAGASTDGTRISSGNLIVQIAPEDKRPVYVALQANITSLGLFFSIIGGFVLSWFGYTALYSLTLCLLLFAFFVSFKLKD